MAAEGFGLAASVAGLVSLGLQITGGVVKYIDALDSRQEELSTVQQQNDLLKATILAIEKSSSGFELQELRPDLTAAVARNIQHCKNELNAAEAIRVELSDSQDRDWKARLQNKSKKLVYAFNRSKLQQLGQRLQQANDSLRLTLNGLGLEISLLNTKTLNLIESSTQKHSSELLLVRSEVATIEVPVVEIRDQLPALQRGLNATSQLIAAQSEADRHFHDMVQRKLKEQEQRSRRIEKLLKLQVASETRESNDVIARRAAAKPAVLRELCDIMETSAHGPAGCASTFRHPDSLLNSSAAIPKTRRLCICPRPHQKTIRNILRLGPLDVLNECETKGHWPDCPLSKAASKKKTAMEVRYRGLAHILGSIISVSFAWTSGAGGFSISPNFTYYPTVDETSDPALRIIRQMISSDCHNTKDFRENELFLLTCLKRLARLLNENKVRPTAVNHQNQTLLHMAARVAGSNVREDTESAQLTPYVKLVELLVSYGVPAFSYNTKGRSPILALSLYRPQVKSVVNALVDGNLEGLPVHDGTTPTANKSIYIQPIYEISHGFAEACGCGPLSMAVIRNDVDQVTFILSQYPRSLEERDFYGNNPIHLATWTPKILSVLVQTAGPGLLNAYDNEGHTPLGTAIMLSGRRCANGESDSRCRRCACAQSVGILLDAGCHTLLCRSEEDEDDTHFTPTAKGYLLRVSSELARRRYAFGMRTFRDGQLSKIGSASKDDMQMPAALTDNASQTARFRQYRSRSRIFSDICQPKLADIFIRHGFEPCPDFLLHLGKGLSYSLCPDYLCWLIDHGVDLLVPSVMEASTTRDTAGEGLCGAYYALGHLDLGKLLGDHPRSLIVSLQQIIMTVARRNLRDSCRCHCSPEGCSPLTWLMGKIIRVWRKHEGFPIDSHSLVLYFKKLGRDLALQTYNSAIKLVTFQALRLRHTCRCHRVWEFSHMNTTEEQDSANGGDDADSINEEQAFLLGVHKRLVTEFEVKAVTFLKAAADGNSDFGRFWSEYWLVRMKEELEKLDNDALTDAERRGAEEVGVRWHGCEPQREEQGYKNPYKFDTLAWRLYDLDAICPEYAEPWPEGVHEEGLRDEKW